MLTRDSLVNIKMKSKNPKVLILAGYGLNCEDETKYAFDLAGADSDIIHINDLIESSSIMKKYQILVIPGGFSYGDDTGSGLAYANRLKHHLGKEVSDFVERDKLILGICNGFQILTQLGLLPGALLHNNSVQYIDRWVDVKVSGQGPWLRGIDEMSLPIAHGEGRYYAPRKTLTQIQADQAKALTYIHGKSCEFQSLPANPNGSLENIAGITSRDGRILGMMPHPERAVSFYQTPFWPNLQEEHKKQGKKIDDIGPGLKLFKNAVGYFN
jgi:phosphoribosylformylglycinamidine synthase